MAELTLVLEASTGTGSLALLRDSEVVAEARVAMRGHDGERLMPALVQMLGDAGITTGDVSRIVCGNGPGGFTSLRIAAAIAKGLAESLGIELWAASSLAILAANDAGLGAPGAVGASLGGAAADGGGAVGGEAVVGGAAAGGGAADRPTEVIAVLDALRGEWYTQRFARALDGTIVASGAPALLGREALTVLAAGSGAHIVGSGGDSFPGGRAAAPLARDVARIKPGESLAAVELAGWEPDYGRLAEAQVKWEKAHGRALGTAG